MEDHTSAEEHMRLLMKQRTATDRLQMCSRMFSTAKALALAGIEAENDIPEGTSERCAIFLRFYASDFPQRQREEILEQLARRSERSR